MIETIGDTSGDNSHPLGSNSNIIANEDQPQPQASSSSSNPFKSTTYQPTTVADEELIKFPFKTLNRILEDVRWTIPFMNKYNRGILNTRTIDYSSELGKLALNTSCWRLNTLNNYLDYAKTTETIELNDRNQTIKTIRGLLTNDTSIYHFKLTYLENNANPFIPHIIDKHEFHVIPQSLLSQDDLTSLSCGSEDFMIENGFFKSLINGSLLRVSVYSQHFIDRDLRAIIDQETINQRYQASLEKYPELPQDKPLTIGSVIKKLIQVLKGPILIKPNEHIKTISLKTSYLDSHLDINLLYDKLGFCLHEETQEIVPPNLSLLPHKKEEYIRRILELIYLTSLYCKTTQEFKTIFSFSDNASPIFQAIPEVDRHNSQLNFNSSPEQLPFLTNLSVSPYFQDEVIIKCFENSVKSDPSNKLYYVDSIRNTANYLTNSTSNTKLTSYLRNLANHGELIGYHDFINALKSIGIREHDFQNVDKIDEDGIIAVYKARYKNDPKNYMYFRKQLHIIAKAKRSPSLLSYINKEIIPLEIALDELNIEEITEDEVVVTAYEFKLDDILQSNGFNSNSDEVTLLHNSLLSVAINRKSYLLMDYIETKLPHIIIIPDGNINTELAYSMLDSTSSDSDFTLIINFQNKLMNPNSEGEDIDIRSLRYGMKLIAESRKSEMLLSFLKTGRLDSSLLPADSWPAGLDNIGNTCYLNSLLQYYFCIKPLRDLILTFDERNINTISLHKNRKIGGRKVEDSEIKRSNQFIYHLRYLFDEMIHTNKRCVQPTKELAYMAFLPLSQQVSFKNTKDEPEIIEVLDTDEEIEFHNERNPIVVETPEPETMEVDDLHSDISLVIVDKPVNPDSKRDEKNISILNDGSDIEVVKENDIDDGKPILLPIGSDQIESTIEVGRQQDVTECIENVTYQIETALEPEKVDEDGEQYDLIKKLFYGKVKQKITPLNNDETRTRVSFERFFSLIINVSDSPKNIYDSLDSYFREDMVKLEEGECKKSLTLAELPEILQFHVQRVMFDRERLMAYKSLQPIPFSEKIYLDRYLETDDPDILHKRNEIFKWKSEIQQLTEKKNEILEVDPDSKMTIIESLLATKKYLEAKVVNDPNLDISESTISVIDHEIQKLKEHLESIDSRLKDLTELVSNQFVDYTKVGYSIFAIFIHRGEASYGHYWVYIKDPHKNVFRKYNDEVVSEVPLSEVFNFNEGNTATPYYIVYVKDNLEKEYVDPLKRIITKE